MEKNTKFRIKVDWVRVAVIAVIGILAYGFWSYLIFFVPGISLGSSSSLVEAYQNHKTISDEIAGGRLMMIVGFILMLPSIRLIKNKHMTSQNFTGTVSVLIIGAVMGAFSFIFLTHVFLTVLICFGILAILFGLCTFLDS